ncbi:MAG TPA: arginine--tRNA ligase [Gemmatimonadaceae bacterium]|nr:arginine--tRNA ligase [Gemmatimonadaceae bacterium]
MSSADAIRSALAVAARRLGAPDDVEPVLERPRDPSFGDWATNLAMLLARPLGRKPRDVAQALIDGADLRAAGVSSAEIAGPGFINFRLDASAATGGLAQIIAAGDSYGRSEGGAGRRVVVEFVSANPTGPLHVGHGRQAALGDAIATLLSWTGWDVSREFYYNDAGVQIENLALSTWLRVAELLGEPVTMPKFAYHGEYIRDIALRFRDARPTLDADAVRRGAREVMRAADEIASLPESEERRASAIRARAVASLDGATFDDVRTFAVQALRREQDLDLQAFGVKFDTYYLESSLYTDGKVEETVAALEQRGMTYEKDDALWLKTTEFGDDKDRVMRKRDGTYTYFVPDVAYHVTKWQRGFPRAINVQGADHHSTVTRVRAGLQAVGMGIPAGYPDYVLHQMVTVMRGGEEMKISKRAGSYVTVRDLVDEVGRDAVRYFFLMRKGDSQLVFDVDLARTQSEENPVYYVQMAHARMCGIFRVGGIDRSTFSADGVDLAVLAEPAERELTKALLDFPATVASAAEGLEPQRIATYLHDTAQLAHGWYHKHHVLGEPEPIMRARLVLARAAQVVLANGLALLGITAPERM